MLRAVCRRSSPTLALTKTFRMDAFDHTFVQPASFDASLAFYRDALGWKVQFFWGGNGEPRGASLSSGRMRMVLAERHATDDHSWSDGVNGTRPTVHLMVDDVEERYKELVGSGSTLFPPENTHWGTRWFVAKDPDGNLIAFEQRREG